MAFNYLQSRMEALNPFQKSFASPAYFDVYLSAPPRCMSDPTGIEQFFGGSTFGKVASTVVEIGSNLLFGDPAQIRFRVKAIDLPQRQLETQPRLQVNGPQRLVPYGAVYSTVNMEIIESDQYKIREFFEEWQDKVFHKDNSYKLAYYNELVADKLTVVAYAATGLPVRVWEMTEAFPIAINSSQMSWDATDQYLVINIEMAFNEWTSSSAKLSTYLDAATVAAQGLIPDIIENGLGSIL